jgi:hypothetical protein
MSEIQDQPVRIAVLSGFASPNAGYGPSRWPATPTVRRPSPGFLSAPQSIDNPGAWPLPGRYSAKAQVAHIAVAARDLRARVEVPLRLFTNAASRRA